MIDVRRRRFERMSCQICRSLVWFGFSSTIDMSMCWFLIVLHYGVITFKDDLIYGFNLIIRFMVY